MVRKKKGAMIGMLPTPSPEWWEMLDWNEMKNTWWKLKEETRQKVRDCGKAPKYDKKSEKIMGKYPCPKCGSNDWEPILWSDLPYDLCKKCGYQFTFNDVPKKVKKNNE